MLEFSLDVCYKSISFFDFLMLHKLFQTITNSHEFS
jgi:hypothetical protein